MPKGKSKTEILIELQLGWVALSPKEKKDLIYSLLGHRMSLQLIAQKIGKSVEEVRAAYRGDSLVMYVAPDFDGPTKLVEDNQPDFTGLPTQSVSKKVAEIAPNKAIYGLTFDEILEKYRTWVGWDKWLDTCPAPGKGPDDPKYLNGLIISDIHAPFQDEQRFAKMIADTKGKVDVCILGGDGPDFHNYSKYLQYGQHFTIDQEHKSYLAVLATLSESYPEVIVIPGNHDDRTRKKYANLLPADLYQSLLDFHGPNAFDFAELMTRQFENIVIPTMPKNGFAEYRFVYQIYDIVVGHPSLYSKIPNKSVGGFIDWIYKKAIPMDLVHGPVSAAVVGHTHMAGKTWNDYGVVGIENGCLCMTPDYDAGDKLQGAPRPLTRGYTVFKTNKTTGKTSRNDIQFVELE